MPAFLSPPGDASTIERVLDHVDYISGLVGPEHLAIGTDWPLALPHPLQKRLLEPLLRRPQVPGGLLLKTPGKPRRATKAEPVRDIRREDR